MEFVRETLPGVQGAVSRVLGDRAGAAFLASFPTTSTSTSASGLLGAARIRSASSGLSSAWITALPGATTSLSDADFVAAGRHLLGLGVPTAVAMPPCSCGGGQPASPDHAMVCRQLAGVSTLRHDQWASAWRRVIRRAGCATSAEPAYSGLQRQHGRGGAAGLRRGDILAVMPGGRIAVLDCVVTHPAAASYVREAARTTGSAAAKAEHDKRREFRAHGENAGYDFVPLAVESFGRLGRAASRFLSELGDVASAGANGLVSRAAFVRGARQELSCALCRGNARLYHESMFAIARAVGRSFLPGCESPEHDIGEV